MTCRGVGVLEGVGGVGVPTRLPEMPGPRIGSGLWIKRCCCIGGVGLSVS